jgi:hypothetical protein
MRACVTQPPPSHRARFDSDIWDDTGDSIVEHVAGVDDFEVAEATYRAAVARAVRPSFLALTQRDPRPWPSRGREPGPPFIRRKLQFPIPAIRVFYAFCRRSSFCRACKEIGTAACAAFSSKSHKTRSYGTEGTIVPRSDRSRVTKR